jgi:hypothetical protein
MQTQEADVRAPIFIITKGVVRGRSGNWREFIKQVRVQTVPDDRQTRGQARRVRNQIQVRNSTRGYAGWWSEQAEWSGRRVRNQIQVRNSTRG